jgi:hypothetical protein
MAMKRKMKMIFRNFLKKMRILLKILRKKQAEFSPYRKRKAEEKVVVLRVLRRRRRKRIKRKEKIIQI